MRIIVFAVTAVLIGGCASVDIFVAPDATLKRGATIQMTSMTSDPLGGVARITAALTRRGFTVLAGEVGGSVTKAIEGGTSTYRPTEATHLLTFTYTTRGDGQASCQLINVRTRKTEVNYTLTNGLVKAVDGCANAIASAAK